MSSTDPTDTAPSTDLELIDKRVTWLRDQLEQVQEQASAALEVRRTVGPLDQWVTVVRDYEQLANTLCRTEFVPKEFRGKPEQTTAAMMFGREIGLQPMTTLQNTYVVNGRVGMYAEQLRAMILAAGHEYSIDETTSDRCVISGKRKGSERWSTFTYTMDMAKNAGLWAQNDNYKKRPVEMLFARATGLMAHGMFPDVIRGMGVVEELEDQVEGEPPTVQQVEPAAKVQRTAKKAAAKAIEKAPPASPAVEKAEVVIPDEPGLPPLPGEVETPRDVKAEPTRTTEQEATARPVSEGDGSPDDVAATGFDAEVVQEERHCPDWENLHDPHAWGATGAVDPGPAPFWCAGLQARPEPTPDNPVVDLPHDAGAGVTTGPVAEAPKPVHRGQVTALQARFKKLGYTDEPDDREARLKVAAVFAGVDEIDSFNDLTYDGAMRVLRAMENFTGRDDVLEAMVQAARGEQGA